jgi:hypothetical protein
MSHASRDHRLMDAACAEAVAQDGKSVTLKDLSHGAALLPSRQRAMDLRSFRVMSRHRVLLTKLSVRTSAKGREYLAGYLGKASVVGFKAAEPDKFGNPVWDIFACEPEPREGASVSAASAYRERQERASAPAAVGGVDADFDTPW